MKKSLQEKLYKKYPNLYKDQNKDITQTAMCWGIECGDGWYNIIDELSKRLEDLNCVASQVKSKFRGLRFYLNEYDNKAHYLIEKAESKSYSTCEYCGGKAIKHYAELVSALTLCKKCKNIKHDKSNS